MQTYIFTKFLLDLLYGLRIFMLLTLRKTAVIFRSSFSFNFEKIFFRLGFRDDKLSLLYNSSRKNRKISTYFFLSLFSLNYFILLL